MITNDGNTIEGKFYANDGSKKDQFTIKKSGGAVASSKSLPKDPFAIP